MKVEVRKIDNQYNQFGCGYRLLFLIIYNRTHWISRHHGEQESIHLNRGLNKLVEYWNYHGNANGRDMIIINKMWVPIDSLGVINEEDYTAIETESYGYRKREYLSRTNLYYMKEKEVENKNE